jgi:hypothetical protein
MLGQTWLGAGLPVGGACSARFAAEGAAVGNGHTLRPVDPNMLETLDAGAVSARGIDFGGDALRTYCRNTCDASVVRRNGSEMRTSFGCFHGNT